MDQLQIKKIEQRISELPSGGITYKTISGKRYAYYQWSEGGKQHARRVKDDEFDSLSKGIEERKSLQKSLKESESKSEPKKATVGKSRVKAPVMPVEAAVSPYSFFSTVRTGDDLYVFVSDSQKYNPRNSFVKLANYLSNDEEKIFIIYGLRRTGKTMLMRQAISALDESDFSKCAYIRLSSQINMTKFSMDMKELERRGFKYLFIDEFTLMDSFPEALQLLASEYLRNGMKIVISGNDSLVFALAEDDFLSSLFTSVRTTFIPFSEYASVFSGKSADDYIRTCGTMGLDCDGGIDEITFSNVKNAAEYIKETIAKNIRQSLEKIPDADIFPSLNAVAGRSDFSDKIIAALDCINGAFCVDSLVSNKATADLAVCFERILSGRENESNPVLNRELQKCFSLLDLTRYVDIEDLENYDNKKTHVVFTQPGLRYVLTNETVKKLMSSNMFHSLSLKERNSVTDVAMDTVSRQILKDMVLLETTAKHPSGEVFSVKYKDRSLDMVVFSPEKQSCEIYEVFNSKEPSDDMQNNLLDKSVLSEVEHRYGEITSRNIIYLGKKMKDGDINYIPINDFLGIKEKKK